MRLFARADVAIGRGIGFIARFALLPSFQVSGFRIRQLTGFDAVGNALLLVGVALHVSLQALQRGRIRVARRRVVLVAIDIAIGQILLVLDPRFFLRRQRTVAHIPRLRTVDVLLIAFELAGFPGRKLARLQALFDALLLVGVALGFTGGALGVGADRCS